MGGYKTWAALEEVTAADMNTYVRDNTVPQFASAAARSAAIAAPVVGTMSYLTDTGSLEVYYGATTGWRPPWARPWGIVPVTSGANPDSVTGNQNFTSATVADITGLTATFTAVANRNYRVTIVTNFLSSGIGDIAQVLITDSANAVKIQSAVNCQNGLFGVSCIATGVITLSAGSTTLKGRACRQSGSGTVTLVAGSVYPTQLTIEDIGPTGNAPGS